MMTNPFNDAAGRPRLIRGVTIATRSTAAAEIAIKVGFDAIWVEMEHGSAGFETAESLCVAAESAGGFGVVRLPDGQRCHVLRALEIGARILIVPQVNTADEARSIVEFGKFPPIGARGINRSSRGFGYGFVPVREGFIRQNEATALVAQIETLKAVENLDAILAVDGLDGVLIGPGDLSVSLGKPADFDNPELLRHVSEIIKRARAAGKHAGIAVNPGPVLDAALGAGCDLVFCGSDVGSLLPAWKQLLADCVRSVD